MDAKPAFTTHNKNEHYANFQSDRLRLKSNHRHHGTCSKIMPFNEWMTSNRGAKDQCVLTRALDNEEDLIMVNRHRRLPSSVILKHREEANYVDASEGTSTTCIMISPVSSDHNTQVDTDLDQRKSSIGISVSHWMNDEHIHSQQRDVNNQHHYHSHHSKTSLDNKDKQSKRRRSKKMNKNHSTLTWRMDPSVSLSDFTLTFIGINDQIAIQKYVRDRQKTKKKKRSKRRDKWIVDGLYLDRSQSSDDEHDDSDDCHPYFDSDDIGHGTNRHASESHDHSTKCRLNTSNNTVVEHYHLHKVNLAVGQRGCEYFARLFQEKDDASGSSSNHSHYSIEIPVSCLPAIPTMLDYFYDPHPNAQVNATTTTAVPLRFLGTYFGNRLLFDSATHFLHKDLRPATAIDYLQHAELFCQEKLADVCIRICAESFDQLKVTWFASLSPHLMIRILHSRFFRPSINPSVVCSKIASYCRCQMHNINRNEMLLLTDARSMPVMCHEEALFFIHFMIRLGIAMEDLLRDDDSKERKLYERCIGAAPEVIRSIINSACSSSKYNMDRIKTLHNTPSRQTKNARSDYYRLPPQIKVQLLELTLAHQEIRKLGDEV